MVETGMVLNPCTDAFLNEIETMLPGILSAPEPRHLSDMRGGQPGQSRAVARPRSTAEVAALMRAAHGARVGVIPFGGGTGLVRGQVSDGPDALLLSLERMNAVRAVYPLENVLIAEAGVTVAQSQAAARAAGRLFPLSLASEGTATVGGTLATNAGGLNVLRYGTARESCLGLEVVLADGQVWQGLKRLRKDNTGYDLKSLFAGSEGTLGIITAASMRLFPVPMREVTALVEIASPLAALQLLARAQDRYGSAISAFELISGVGLDFLSETLPDVPQPFAPRPDWMVLIDIGLPGHGEDPGLALAEMLAHEGAECGAMRALISRSEADRTAFWRIREMIPEGNRRTGSILSNDISLPISAVPDFLDAASQGLKAIAPLRINAFGHLGDGNLHYNFFTPKGGKKGDFAHLKDDLLRLVNDLVAQFDGSFSAEHGVGRVKVAELERYADKTKLALLRQVKAALDPLGILNPGVLLRE